MNIRLRDKRVVRTVALLGIVGAAAALILSPKGREQTSLALQKARPTVKELTPMLHAGAENILNLAENHRSDLVDAVTLLLTNQSGAANINDKAARERAERLVDQGAGLLRAFVQQTKDTAQTIEGQVVEPLADPA